MLFTQPELTPSQFRMILINNRPAQPVVVFRKAQNGHITIDKGFIIGYSGIMTNINTNLTKAEMKALVIVLSAGYAAGKEGPDDVRDIFIKDYDQSHALALGIAYSRALRKLGLDAFWDDNEKFISQHRNA